MAMCPVTFHGESMGYMTLIWTQRNGILWVGDSFAPRARPRLDLSRHIYLMISRVAAEVRGDTTHCFTTSAWVLGGGGTELVVHHL